MGMLTSIVAILAIAYGILTVVVALNIGDRFADKKCNKDAVKSNQGLLVVGGAMLAFGVSYLSCNFMCECKGGDYLFDNSIVFSVGLIVTAILCITLSAIVENKGKDCIENINKSTMAVWISAVIILLLGLLLAGMHLWTGFGTYRGNVVRWVS